MRTNENVQNSNSMEEEEKGNDSTPNTTRATRALSSPPLPASDFASDRTDDLHAQIEKYKQAMKAKDDEVMKAKDEAMKAKDGELKAKDEAMKAKDEELMKAKDEAMKAKNEVKAKDEELMKAKDEAMKAKDGELKAKGEVKEFQEKFPTMRELTNSLCRKHNETVSSAHTSTGHKTATFKKFQVLPDISDYLEKSEFWECRPGIKASSLLHSVNSESDVSFSFRDLLNAVIEALKLDSALVYKAELPMMDVRSDGALAHIHNGAIVSTIESKKEPRGDEERKAMFDSGTQVTGEVCNQLFLSSIQMRTQTFGVLTTFNELRLVSTGDLTAEALDAKETVDFFCNERDQNAEESSPTKPRIVTTPRRSSPNLLERILRSKRPRLEISKKKGTTPRAQQRAESENIKREYFSSDILRIDQGSTTNKKYVECMALFVLLSANSLRKSLVNSDGMIMLSEKLKNQPARKVNIEKGVMGFSSVSSDVVQWEEMPSEGESIFYSIQQLGYGDTGCCCLAFSENLVAPCVIKFYFTQHAGGNEIEFRQVVDVARREAENWRLLYNDRFEFVKVSQFGTKVLLIMPFLNIASDADSRKSLCYVEDGSPEESKLYKALTYMAVTKKFKHTDLKWRHIGQYYTLETGDEEPGSVLGFNRCGQSNENEFESEVMFCDLEALEKFGDGEDAVRWVDDVFKNLVRRIGS